MQCWPANSSPIFRSACCLPPQEGTYVTTLLLQQYLYTVQPNLLYRWILLCGVLDLLSGWLDGLWLCAVLGDTCLLYKVQALCKCDSCLSEWHDITSRLFVFLQVLYNLPASVCVWLAYLVPAYSMTGLHMQGNDTSSFYVYVGK